MNGSLDPKLIKHDNKLNEIRNDHPYLLQTICSSSMTTTLSGAWYYEVLLLTDGVVHIGWATPACQFIPEQAYGVGDNLVCYNKSSYSSHSSFSIYSMVLPLILIEVSCGHLVRLSFQTVPLLVRRVM